jgi:hypothetical protein
VPLEEPPESTVSSAGGGLPEDELQAVDRPIPTATATTARLSLFIDILFLPPCTEYGMASTARRSRANGTST